MENYNSNDRPATYGKRAVCASVICGALLCAHTGRAFTNEFWVATNGNLSATGTIGDPYDGSTQPKFDAVMNAMPTNCTIHLLGGTYLTKGAWDSFWIKTGQKILGSGMDITTVKLTNSSGHGVMGSIDPNAVGIEVCDLTIDANGQSNGTNLTWGGISIGGSHAALRRVKVKNLCHGTEGYSEVFGIIVAGTDNVSAEGFVIEDCVVMPPISGSVCSSIAIFAGTNAYVSGRLSGNRVYGTNTTSMQAFNLCNSLNTLLIGNHVVDVGAGVYSDSGGNTNLTLANNDFKNVTTGVLLGGLGKVHKNLNFTGNVFEMAYLTNQWVYALGFSSDALFTNISITGNTLKPYAAAGPSMRAVDARSATGVVIADNRIHSGCDFYLTGSSNVNLHDNVDLFGNFITNANQIELPNSLTRATVSGSSYTAKLTDRYIGIQYSSGTTVTLPSASGIPGKEFIVANETSSSTSNTIAASSGTVNGSASISFSGGYTSRTVISDGSNWFAR
jgi:hypothetical protein